MNANQQILWCAETEAELQDKIIQLAHIRGWLVAHFRPARTEKGWRTPVAADGGGFPDLVLVRERVLWIECKSEKGRISLAQADWFRALGLAHQECYLWHPHDWEWIEKVLN